MAEKKANKYKKGGHTFKGYNKPIRTPGHPTKKGAVLAKDGNKIKLIRFGDQKMGHNYSKEARKSFKARHAKNIKKGKMSAAYWANKKFWAGPKGSKKRPPKSQKIKKGVSEMARIKWNFKKIAESMWIESKGKDGKKNVPHW